MKVLRDLDEIKADDDLKQRTLQSIKKKWHIRYTSYKIVGAMLCVVCCVGILLNQMDRSKKSIPPEVTTKQVYAYVSVDINPSLEFQLDKGDKVMDIVTYNEEANIILKDYDMKGKQVTEAFEWLLSDARIQDYMNTGFMQVSVYSEDNRHSLQLEQEIDTSLSMKYDASQYGCSCASSSTITKANQSHMSFGKYQVIESILEHDASYSLEELRTKRMQELVSLYEQVSGQSYTQTHPGGGTHHGEGNRTPGNMNGKGNGKQGHGNGQKNQYGN